MLSVMSLAWEGRTMSRFCKSVVAVFGLLYLAALALFVIGRFGLFGSPSGPLAGVFLVPLGMPWVPMIDVLPEPLWPWAAAGAPLVNLAILTVLCRVFSRR